MKVSLTTEEQELQESFRSIFQREWTPERRRAFRDSDDQIPEHLWNALTTSGFFGLAFPEEYGGGDGSLVQLGLVFQEAGRVLFPAVVYDTIAAGLFIDQLGSDDQRSHWLSQITSGTCRAALALWGNKGRQRNDRLPLARRSGAQWAVTGQLQFVTSAHSADVIVALARIEGGGLGVFLLKPGGETWSEVTHSTLGGEPQSTIELIDHPVATSEILGDPAGADVASTVDQLESVVLALQCMEMLGGNEAVLHQTVEYVKQREQFGKPIGSFQAVRHHVADMSIAFDGARLVCWQALWLVARGDIARREVSIAKAKVGESYKSATLTAHQLHGGMGFILETDLHYWSERAKTTELQAGSSDVHLARLWETICSKPPGESSRNIAVEAVP